MFASIRLFLFALIAAVCAQSHFASEAQAPTGMNLKGSPMNAAYKSTVLRHMNVHRQNYSSPKLVWDSGLADIAQHRANLCRNLGINRNALNRNSTTDLMGYAYANHTYPDTQIGQLFTEDWHNTQWKRWSLANKKGDACSRYGCYEWSQMINPDASSVGCYTYDCNDNKKVHSYVTVCLWWSIFNTCDANMLKIKQKGNGTASIHGSYGCPDKKNCVNDNYGRRR